MLKLIGGFLLGVGLTVLVAWKSIGGMMFSEQVSPFSLEETTARIQQNIQAAGNGWSISGLRNPIKPLEAEGSNALPVLLIEACSTGLFRAHSQGGQRSLPVIADALQDCGLQEK